MTGSRHAARSARILVVSQAQQRRWLLRRLLPERPPGRLAWSARLTGPLDGARLANALRCVAARHPVLCAEFVTDGQDGWPRWHLQPGHRLPVEYLGAQQPSSSFMMPADGVWRRGHQWQARLTRASREEHQLDIAVAEGLLGEEDFTRLWSQVTACYESGVVPSGGTSFTRYVRLEPTVPRSAAARWIAAEPLAETPTELPADRPRPAWQCAAAATHEIEVPELVRTALRDQGSSWAVSPQDVMFATFAVLVGRFAGLTDLQLGSWLGRGRADRRLRRACPIGVENEPLPVRIDLTRFPTLGQLARDISHRDAAHPARPALAALLVEAKAGADLSRSPLFQLAFAGSGAEIEAICRLGEATVRWQRQFAGAAPCDLLLALPGSRCPARGYIRYRADLFEPPTIRRLADHYLEILASVAGDPEVPHAKLARRAGSRMRSSAPSSGDLVAGVEAAARHTPDACAVSFAGQSLTYSGLVARSSQIAAWLREQHSCPVGIRLDHRGQGAVALGAVRHLDLLPMAIGILAAGGSIVPVSSGDARAAAVLAQCGVSIRLVPGASPAAQVGTAAGPLVAVAAPPQAALAYYLTSGTSGGSKVVISTHAGTAHYRDYLRDVVGLKPSDVVLQLASLTFDASIRDLLCPVAVGARVVLVDDAEITDAAAISERMREAQVTAILAVVPSVLRHLITASPAAPSSLRVVLISGETLTPELAAAARSWAPQARLVNQYGLTECTMTSTYHELIEADGGSGPVPVGQPIPSASVHILDRDGALCAHGALGEVALGGPGVARGYTDPGLTAAQFVPDPWGPPGSRMFRTGDFGRAGPDGELRLHGRADRQVKVRGTRVELDDAEALVRSCTGVNDAAVVFADGELQAYLVGPTDGTQVRRHLAGRVPSAMIPTRYVNLPQLPKTASGKLDRRALPPPERHPGVVPGHPRDLAELMFAEYAEDALGHRGFGVTDDLLDAGLNSRGVLTIAASASAGTARSLPPADIYAARTVEVLAARYGAGDGRLVRLGRGQPGQRPVVVLPDAAGQAVRYARLAERVRNPLYAIEAAGTQPGGQPREDFAGLVGSCIDVLAGFGDDDLVLLGWGLGGQLALAAAASVPVPTGLVVAVVAAADECAGEALTPAEPAVVRYAKWCTPCSWQDLPADPGRAAQRLLRYLKLRGQLPPDADAETLWRLVAVYTAATSSAVPAELPATPCDVTLLLGAGEQARAPAWIRTTGALTVHVGNARWRPVPSPDNLVCAADDLAMLVEGAEG